MPDDAHDHAHNAEQPFLHDLRCLLEAPMQAWTASDGSIEADGGAQGIYVGDTRIVRELTLRPEGWSMAHLSSDESVPRRQVLRGVLRRGGSVIDPEIVLVRERVVTGETLGESIRLLNASRHPVTVTLTLRLVPDATPMHVIKAGVAGTDAVRASADGWSAEDGRTRVRLVSDGDAMAADGGVTIGWTVVAAPGESATATWSLEAHDDGAVVAAPSIRHVAAAADHVAIPEGRAFDLGRLVRQAFDDLDGLELTLPSLPDAPFLAAGAPWFLTLFGRDSIVAAGLLLPATTVIARGTLAALAHLQGTTDDVAAGEAPGKIVHELRRGVTHHLGSDHALELPPRYYGTVDATPLWISLLHDTWRAGMATEDVAALAPNLEAAVSWLRATVAADPRGFLAYHDPSGRGLANQGWKDSGDAVRWADGSLAGGPIALSEAQGYAVRAARQAADVLDAVGRGGTDELREWADALSDRFRTAFWVEDEVGSRYPAIALDGEGRAVDGAASNMGHLLGTGILDADERRLVVARLMDPTLFSGFGIRTLSTTNGGYWPMRYHAGAVWPHDTAMIIDGMLSDGFLAEAKTVAEGLLAAAASFDWRLPELFAGVPRDESSRAIPYPAACRPQAWSAAAAVVVARALSGAGAAPAATPPVR
jgi:glycogen debranching enzyme